MIRGRYGRNLRSAVGSSAAPYGFTLSVWTSGAIISHARGIPDALHALLFMVGAVLAFALVGALAYGDLTGYTGERQPGSSLWGNFHFLSVGLSIGAAALVTGLVDNGFVWILASFSSTTCYLIGLGFEFTVSERMEEDDAE